MTLLVLGVRSRRNRTGVDGRTSSCVGYHFAVAEELRNQFHVRSFAATRASARELEQRSSELRVLHVGLDVYQVLFALYVFYAVSPVGSFAHLAFQVNHRQSLATLLRVARTYVNAVAATQTVEYVYLHAEGHAVEYLSYGLQLSEVGTLLLLGVENKRTDGSVRTNVSTLVTLDTVLGIPSRNEGSYATFLILGSTLFPSTVFDTLEGRYRQQVAVLSVDGTNHFVDESGSLLATFSSSGRLAHAGSTVSCLYSPPRSTAA